MYISQLELWCILQKIWYWILKMDCNLTDKYDSKSVFSGDITLSNQLYLFGHVVRASPRGWSSEIFAGDNGEICGRMEKTNRTPLNNLDLKREERPCTTEYLHQLGFEKDTRQNWLATSCSYDHVLAWDLPVMMTMMIFMITNIVEKDLQTWHEHDLPVMMTMMIFMITNIVEKDLQTRHDNDFGKLNSIKNYFTNLLYYRYNQSRWGSLDASPFTSVLIKWLKRKFWQFF